MNKLTLFSLSLLMISACNAMDTESKKQDSETPTHYILSRLRNAKSNRWCLLRSNDRFECNKSVKELALYSKKTHENKVYSIEDEDESSSLKSFLHVQGDTIDQNTTVITIKKPEAITEFERRLNFRLNRQIQNKTLNDENFFCFEADKKRLISDGLISDDKNESSKIYMCAGKTKMSLDDFAKKMQAKGTVNPVVIPPSVSKEELAEMRAEAKALEKRIAKAKAKSSLYDEYGNSIPVR